MLKQQDCPDYPVCSDRGVKSLEFAYTQGQGVASCAAKSMALSQPPATFCLFSTKDVQY